MANHVTILLHLLVVLAHHLQRLPLGHVHFVFQVHDVIFSIRVQTRFPNSYWDAKGEIQEQMKVRPFYRRHDQ